MRPSLDVMQFMSAKEALTMIRNLNMGMPESETYFTDEDFITVQPRVVKQNCGPSGEGFCIINMKSCRVLCSIC